MSRFTPNSQFSGSRRFRCPEFLLASYRLFALLLAAGCLCVGSSICIADEGLIKALRDLDSQVVAAEQRESMASQVHDDQQRRLRQANLDSSAEWRSVRSREDWVRMRDAKLFALRNSLSVTPVGRTAGQTLPVRVESSGQIAGAGFVIEKIVFESQPQVWVSANLYRPEPARKSMPGIIISHAHHTSKTHLELQDMGMTWARAGCLVLISDHLGHGERRAHPFSKAADFEKKFRVGPADYYFRYDNALQLDLIGESLMGWMVRDLSRGLDVLQSQPGIDSKRLILLGAVAGGGDPAAVAGALDERLAADVPFNFGGPQPETRYPLPDDAESSFDYAGSGGWESTRNLRCSASDGFLPWVIAGSIAPRRLVYGHEFRWDRERDPAWKRFQTIYGFFGETNALAFAHGHGELKGQPPEASHCTHIGKPHRVKIHEAFERWFEIKVSPEKEYSNPLPSEQLRCWTPELREKLRPQSLAAITLELADSLVQRVHAEGALLRPEARRLDLRQRWERVLGSAMPEKLVSARVVRTQKVDKVTIESVLLTTEIDCQIPCLLLIPDRISDTQPAVLGVCSQGKGRLLVDAADQIASFLRQGSVVCLCDPRGLGESQLSKQHGRRSDATSIASTELMLGRTMLGRQLSDIRTTMAWLRTRPDVNGRSFQLWGESFISPNAKSALFRQPRDDDQALPAPSEPQAALLALLAGLFEDDVVAIDAAGGIASWRLLLQGYLVLMAYDANVPGVLTAGDISDLASGQRGITKIMLSRMVDGLNRKVSDEALRKMFEGALKHGNLELK
jgi:dienelactone hydrolase